MINIKKSLIEQIEKGKEGKNISIPISGVLGNYVEISPNTMYLIGGMTGSGKSTLTQEKFILDALEWWDEARELCNVKLTVIYFGMERKIFMYVAKWISRSIFMDKGINIPYMKILHRRKMSMNEEETSLVMKYLDKYEKWQKEEALIVFEGTKNPTGISMFIDNFAKKHGEIIPRKDGELESRSYKSHHENHIVLIVTDHIGILKKERVDGKKKDNIDKFSDTMRDARDLYGFSPVVVQQLNRGVSDVTRLKLGDTLPKLSDFAETSSTAHDADVVIALLDPYKVLTEDTNTDLAGYNLKAMKDERGAKFYRSIHILKNSFDSDGIFIPCAFHPYFGIFKDMPKKSKEMNTVYYESIINGSHFIKVGV